jgi:hypothetical protein
MIQIEADFAYYFEGKNGNGSGGSAGESGNALYQIMV